MYCGSADIRYFSDFSELIWVLSHATPDRGCQNLCVRVCAGVSVCILVVQALATACVACGPSQPAETKQATARVVEQLVLLVNPENELDHVGTTGPVSFTHTLPCPALPCPGLLLPRPPLPCPLPCLAVPCLGLVLPRLVLPCPALPSLPCPIPPF